MIYPTCNNLDELHLAASGAILYIPNAFLHRISETSYHLVSLANTYRLLGVRGKLLAEFQQSSSDIMYLPIHVRVLQVDRLDPFQWARSSTEIYYYEPSAGKCNCGSVYTSFPTHHSNWCDSQIFS